MLLLCVAVLLVIIYTFIYGISPMPSSVKATQAILQCIDRNQSGKVYELGSGWGHLAFAIARRCPGATVIGVEISPIPWLLSKVISAVSGRTNIQFKRGDLFLEDLHEANLVVCYLYPKAMEKLKEKLERELKPGTVVISNTFAIPGWQPSRIVQLDDLYSSSIYVYTTK